MNAPVRLTVLIISAAAVQLGLLAHLRIAGVAADLLLVLAISAGLVSGERRGAITGFFCGLAMDLLLHTRPFGLSALTYALVGFLTGRYQSTVVRSSRWLPVSIAVVATAAGAMGYVVLARLLSGLDLIDGGLPTTLVLMSLFSAALVLPVRALMAWAWDEPSRVSPRMR